MTTTPSRPPLTLPVDRSAAPPAPAGRADRVVLGLLVAGIAVSIVHYADNWLRYDDYTIAEPSFPGSIIDAWVIPVSWVLFTIAGVLGYRSFRRRRWPAAAAWLGAYSASGLISLGHFVDISPSDLSAFQNTFVWLDVAIGVAVLAVAVWTTGRARTD